ncbi:C40 family peptidase [Streptomyces beihaiensis]|uniref:NlpC/P60 family protein n=1 Tax=Streptomyces beihaiensis TaxID=2984495 RepID=A0ABT3TWY3_9ACTN|nr:NlpC/P60 family protein [Streptomyces beihaiensis]MCX3061554.1 NlpC/P60 family protein [Streptomyces beihaiensis]
MNSRNRQNKRNKRNRLGGGRRGTSMAVIAAAIGAVTVLTAGGTAQAAPEPPPTPTPAPDPTPNPNPTRTPGEAAGKASGKSAASPDLEAVRKKLDTLYHQAAVATDEYNAAQEEADQQSTAIVDLAKKIVAGRQKLDRLKSGAGATAREQYRTGGIPPEAQFLLSGDPGQFLDTAGRVYQGQQAAKNLMTQLTNTQKTLADYADRASAKWKSLDEESRKKAAAKKRIEARIKAAKAIEDHLKKQQRERLRELEAQAEQKAQTAWLSSGVLKEIKAKASSAGEKAVRFATEQLGKPYVWGAEGPDSYDCSGLTSQAWAAAGHPIPRTSQEQWKQLKHVDIKDMRPGDLIIYHDDASHVGMYIGDGAIIHAPHPGRNVTIAGAGSMAMLGVVRPDA